MVQSSRLTARQKAFLDKLVELYREHRGPVHYSDVAERLGVNRFSAYDMLKVLEKKGFAASSYALASEHTGPGRPMVVFAPTSRTVGLLGRGWDELYLSEEWSGVRERVLKKLRYAREANPREALNDLLARLSEASSPLAYCTEMIGALLLNMQLFKARAGTLSPFRVFDAFRTNDATGLETLPGLSVGVALANDDEINHTLTQRLLSQIHRYQSDLSRLGEEGRAMLVRFLEEALEALD